MCRLPATGLIRSTRLSRTGAVLTANRFSIMFDLHHFRCQDGLASTSVGEASARI